MASGRAGGSEREGVTHNSDVLARATRRTRALRLEHDPQPGLNGCTQRAAAVSFLPTGLDWRGNRLIRMSLKGSGRFRLQRRSAKAELTSGGPQCPFPKGSGVFRGRRMPERGKSRFATVSDTYIRRRARDGKRGGVPLADGHLAAGGPIWAVLEGGSG